MSNHRIGFEESLKRTLDNYQAPYEQGSWEAIQGQIARPQSTAGNAFGVLAVIMAACAGVLLGWYFFGSAEGVGAESAQLSTITLERDSFPSIHSKFTDGFLTETNDDITLTDGNTSEDDSSSDQLAQLEPKEATDAVSKTQRSLSDPEMDFPEGESDNDVANDLSDGDTSNYTVELPAVGSMPAIPISVSAREACEGTSVKFEINAEIIDGNYLWNFGDGSFSNQPNPEHTYNKAGIYDITLSVTSNKDGVIRTKTMDQLIVINPKPEADFIWEFTEIEDGVPVVHFHNKSRRASQAQWLIANDLSDEINPVVKVDSRGAHQIELVASNEFGCENKVSHVIAINEDYALMAPTRFSPNGDGLFDTFMPRALMTGDHRFTMKIFEGEQLIYETTDPAKPWNGEVEEGVIAAPGSEFFWTVVVHRPKGDKFYSGSISVVR